MYICEHIVDDTLEILCFRKTAFILAREEHQHSVVVLTAAAEREKSLFCLFTLN